MKYTNPYLNILYKKMNVEFITKIPQLCGAIKSVRNTTHEKKAQKKAN